MSIVKMEAVTIAGRIEDFDSIIGKYVYGREIHLETAMSVLSDKKNLHSFADIGHYDTIVKGASDILRLLNYESKADPVLDDSMTIEQMNGVIDELNGKVEEEKQQRSCMEAEIEKNNEVIGQLDLMLDLEIDLSTLFEFEFVSYRFGHLPKNGYKTLNTYLSNLDTVFVQTAEDATDVWGFYFVPVSKTLKVDEIFSSLYFEASDIPNKYKGTPKEIKKQLIEKNQKLQEEMDALAAQTREILAGFSEKLYAIYQLAQKRQQFADVRKNAVHSQEFFYLIGWMPVRQAAKLEKEIDKDPGIVLFYREAPEKVESIQPPTKLKNNIVFRPFEMFVKMYGLPDYREIDPTPILAVTYILFFGIMFGDVGQSAVLAILGFLYYKFKKSNLGGIIGMVGISGMAFGVIYGSVFGNETLLEHVRLVSPMEQINFMLISTIAIGALIILAGIGVNMFNSVKKGDIGQCLFGHNGLAGMVFYATLIVTGLNMVFHFAPIPAALEVVLLVASLLAMYLQEPLSNLMAKKKNWLPKDGMFYVENIFELFEVVLSFFTNTISFLRIGAFAIVHVGMMMVVAVLSKGGGVGGVIVQILGNILVMGLEGLIVGIQVLRLEYYEMFSRYFSGEGREFTSLKKK